MGFATLKTIIFLAEHMSKCKILILHWKSNFVLHQTYLYIKTFSFEKVIFVEKAVLISDIVGKDSLTNDSNGCCRHCEVL